MARYPFARGSRLRQWIRSQLYVISALLVFAVVIILIYGLNPFGKDNDETVASLPPADEQDGTVEPASVAAAETDPKVTELMAEAVTQLNADPRAVVGVRDRLNALMPMDMTKAQDKTAEAAPLLAAQPRAQVELTDTARKPVTKANPKVTKLMAEAITRFNADPRAVIDTRDRLNELMKMDMSKEQQGFIKDQLSKLADKWLFSRTVFAEDKLCENYRVRRGEQLIRIGERFKVPYQILMQINKIRRPEALQAGQVIKVINGPFRVSIYRSTFTMDLYLQNTFVRSFPVGLGMPGRETPTGLWKVKPGGKMISPRWTDPDTGRTYRAQDPDYPLGSRWIALVGIEGEAKDRTGFAIHGTKDPEQIGTAGSRGCIRLHNGAAILVYNLLEPVQSTVRVED